MTVRHKIDIYSAGCELCDDALATVNQVATSGCEIEVHNMHDSKTLQTAKELGIERIPAVVIDGKLAECCQVKGIDTDNIRKLLSEQ